MTKKEFLDQLFEALENVSVPEKEQIDQYYTELLLDKIEEGLSEEEAVQTFGTPEEAAKMISEDLEESRMEIQTVGGKPAKTQFSPDLLVEEPGITSFDIEVRNASVKIDPSPDQCFRVRYIREENVEVQCSRQGDCFVLREKENRQRTPWMRQIWGSSKSGELFVEIPNGVIDKFRLRSSNASIDIRDILIQKTGSLGTTNAKIRIVGCTQGAFIGSSTNGKIYVEDCTMEKVQVYTTNGKINVGNCQLSHLTCETTNGKICVEQTAADMINLSSTNGSIACDINGVQEDYNIDCHTTNGSCKPSKQINVTSSKSISAHTTNGSIRIDFI